MLHRSFPQIRDLLLSVLDFLSAGGADVGQKILFFVAPFILALNHERPAAGIALLAPNKGVGAAQGAGHREAPSA
jgi:hypothetical protein